MNKLLFAMLLSLGLTACASNPGVMQSSAVNYNSAQAGSMQQVITGTVLSVRSVNIAPATTGVGSVGGAVAGGLLGSQVGGGYGSLAAGLIGAVAGGYAGSAIEGHVSAQPGYQITVHLDNGNTVAITQAADITITQGERVQIIGGYGSQARVTPL
jgi:outer membrane lipoprotein SlyB